MDVFEALYTTRAMRRLKPDPIPDDVVASILDAGIRAPSGGNTQGWRFLTVTDKDTIGQLATLYQQGWDLLTKTVYANAGSAAPDAAGARVRSSAQHLADHWAEVPLLVFGFTVGALPGAANIASGASIYPALWSMCLAARAHGIGSTLTTILNGFPEALRILGVPEDSRFVMAGCLPMGYPTGKWGVAERKPVTHITYAEQWGEHPTWEPPPTPTF